MATRNANSSTKKPSTPAKQKSVLLELNCIVEGESSSFPVQILSTEKVSVLKKAIKTEKPDTLPMAAKNLTLKLIPGGATKKGLSKLPEKSLKELDNELERRSTYFPRGAAEDLIHIIVEPSKEASKRSHVADELGSLSKKVKLEPNNPILNTIEFAGLTEKAMIDGKVDLSLLTKKELTSVLDIKSEKFEKLLGSLINNNWIGSYEEVQMVFVVPQDIYNETRSNTTLRRRIS
ncbi:hypothetical protein BGX27_007787 [Mortierella sp. AM989]|nr:hypothetical protein BGX27_007787 [Mortierella sp. AM989]